MVGAKVLVVTSTDLGWDCVVGVYSTEEALLKDEGDSFTDLVDWQKANPDYILHTEVVK